MVVKVQARVQVTVDIGVRGENWNEHTSMEQVHREARETAVKEITRLCQRYVSIVGTPLVSAIITEEKQR